MCLRDFKEAFSTESVTDLECACGKHYFSTLGWSDGEFDSVAANTSSCIVHTELDINVIAFEGKEYADYCDCWHERAEKIMGFLKSHHRQIAAYLNLERQRKVDALNAVEVIGDE